MGRWPLGLALLVALPLVVACDRGAAPPRGIVLVSVDTLRPDRLGAYGYERPTSPRFDALAAESILFTRVHSHAPSTLPAHASMLTSLLPQHHGASFARRAALAPAALTLAEVLQESGYRAAAFTGGGQMRQRFGLDQGFDVYEHGNDDLRDATEHGLEWLDGLPSEQPFFLFLHTYEVHHPYDASPAEMAAIGAEPYTGSFGRRISISLLKHINRGRKTADAADRAYIADAYDAGIRRMDTALGELVDELERRRLLDRIVLGVVSDHGEELDEHGRIGWHAHTLYEELLRVPFLLRLPGGRQGGTRSDLQGRLIDVAPTLLAAAGMAVPPSFSGVSLLAASTAAAPTAAPTPRPVVALQDTPQADRQAIRLRGWKLIGDRLYDLENDPGERRNVAAQHPEVARDLAARRDAELAARSRADGEAVELDAETIEQLRALGYLE